MLCGVFAVNIFSTKIFAETGIDQKSTALIIGFANVVGSFFSVYMVGKVGRKTLLVTKYLCICICHTAIIFGFFYKIDILVVVFCVVAILSYQLAGTVGYIYLTDICLQTGVSVGIFFLNLSLLVSSIVIPLCFYSPKIGVGATFAGLDVISFLAMLFCLIFVKETKGLSDDECNTLYHSEKTKAKSLEMIAKSIPDDVFFGLDIEIKVTEKSEEEAV